MPHRTTTCTVTALLLAALASQAGAQDSAALAKRYFDRSIRITEQVKNKVTGEGWCWRAAYNIRHYVKGYEAFGDTDWLDYGVKYYDAVLEQMATGPDGYKGWIGTYGYEKSVWCDVHIGDSILLNGMLDFAVAVHEDPKLKAKYGAKAAQYVELTKKHLIEKWDRRGTWYEDGPYGGYHSWDTYGKPGEFTGWTKRPEINNSTISLPFNKQNDMAKACLKIWRITGEKKYRDKALKIFRFMRSRIQYFDDHYIWCYWEPLGPHDVTPEANDTRHWMNVHPYRNYQAGEVEDVADAYHYGAVFTKTDLQRIVNTNLKVMWNGNKTDPKFRNSNVTLPGYREAPASTTYPTRAGTLWTGLLDFDATIRELYAKRLPTGNDPRYAVDRAYFRNVVMKSPPSFERKIVKSDMDVFDFPTHECKGLVVACVLPSVIDRGGKAFVLCKVPVDGDIQIDLYDAAGKAKKAALRTGRIKGGMDGHAGIFIHTWNGADAEGKPIAPGNYRVRWTVKDGYREFPITIND